MMNNLLGSLRIDGNLNYFFPVTACFQLNVSMLQGISEAKMGAYPLELA